LNRATSAEALDEAAGDGLPVRLGRAHDMCRVRTGGAVDLAQVLGGSDPAQLPAQPVGQHRQLLAQGGRGGRLAVGAGQHRYRPQLPGHPGDVVGELLRGRQPDQLDRVADHQRVAQVVDVLAGAEQVDDLVQVGQRGVGHPLLQVVLHRLDVVQGDPLGLGQLGDPGRTELARDPAQVGGLLTGQPAQPGNRPGRGQVDQPLHLDVQPPLVQRGLRQVRREGCDGAPVPPVQRPERGVVEGCDAVLLVRGAELGHPQMVP
jgi:hypothetical protein